MTIKALTEAQFSDAQDKIDTFARLARKGTPEEQAAFKTLRTEWETAIALPQRTFQQRQDRLVAIATVAVKHTLV